MKANDQSIKRIRNHMHDRVKITQSNFKHRRAIIPWAVLKCVLRLCLVAKVAPHTVQVKFGPSLSLVDSFTSISTLQTCRSKLSCHREMKVLSYTTVSNICTSIIMSFSSFIPVILKNLSLLTLSIIH